MSALDGFLVAATRLVEELRDDMEEKRERKRVELAMDFDGDDAEVLRSFMESDPANEQARVVQGVLRRGLTSAAVKAAVG